MRLDSQKSSDDAPRVKVPVRRRGEARVAALLAAAEDVFLEQGIEAATMTEIARRAGASIGSLYQFFPTKELLAEALHTAKLAVFDDAFAALSHAGESSAADLADRLMAMFVAFLTANPVFSLLADRRGIDKARKAETRAKLRARIGDYLETARPRLPPDQSVVLAVVVLSLLRGMIQLSTEEGLAERDAAIATLRTMLRHHIDGLV